MVRRSDRARDQKTGDASVPIYLNEQHAAELVDMTSAITAVRAAFVAQARGEAVNIPRTRLEFGERRLNLMAGGGRTPDRYALKSYGSSTYHILLYSAEQGLLAIMEANLLGQIRTGAASAIATQAMARPNAGKVGLIGAGRQARTQMQALHCAGCVTEVAVFARDRARQAAFCERLGSELGLPVRAAGSAAEAVADAEIVVTATNSSTPVVMSEWLSPGTHVNAMGANAPSRRELDPQIVLRAALVVTDDIAQAKTEAGEFIDLARAGRLDWNDLIPLHRIVGSQGLRREHDAITLFKSLGVGLEDLAIASLLYDRAAASSRFTPL
jgi:ornithine cyclodeaminase/alanine dehydrogenase-like protein (mu-crystallin family)